METIDTSGRGTSGRYCEPSPALQLTPQDDQLMSEHRILRLKPALRLERRGQHGQNKTEQPDQIPSPLCSRADTRSPRSLGSRPAGDHRQWQWVPDGLVSILLFRYGLNAVHVDSRRAHADRANFFERTTWSRKQRRQRKPRRQPPRRWQRRLPRGRSDLVYDEQIAAPASPEASATSPKDLKCRLRPYKCRGNT
jgi:hypothetical protein